MGFRLSRWDKKLIQFSKLFEERMMNLSVNIPLDEALDLGWKTLSECFEKHEVGIKEIYLNKYWPNAS